MQIGLLQCGYFPQPDAHPKVTYSDLYANMLKGNGFSFRTWSVVDMDFPASAHEADAWLLSGSRHGAYEDIPFIPPLERFIREIYSAQVPMVGICFGHQVVAQALGGKVIKGPKGWNCGRNTYDIEGQEKTLIAWHQDEVVSAPPEAKVVGSSAQCDISFIRYQGKAFTMQPHPEFGDDALRIVMDGPSGKLLSKEQMARVRAGLGTPHDNVWMASEIARFFKHVGDSDHLPG